MHIMLGSLYIVATPIGNLEDITLRALRILAEVDLIACEDTRHTRKLLNHFKILTPTVSYHEHNEPQRATQLIEKLKAGMNIAVVSDAGTPLLSDPGYEVVREAIAAGIAVVPVPGPSALMAALAGAGLATGEFFFAGFLPSRASQRRKRLAELATLPTTLVFYEAPHRLKDSLADARQVLGNRSSVVARELTKLHEEFVRGSFDEVAQFFSRNEVRGEIVLLVGPPDVDSTLAGNQPELQPISLELAALMRDEHLDQKTALKRIARTRGISKSEAYRQLMAERSAASEESSSPLGDSPTDRPNDVE